MSDNDCEVMFNRIFYDARTSTIHLWETVEGKRKYTKFPFKHTFYVEDQSGESDVKDIYGTPMVKRLVDRRSDMHAVVESGLKCCETDIAPEIKFLHERYENVKLVKDMANFNICYLDIETKNDAEFPKPEETKYPINLITMKFSKSGNTYTLGECEYNGNSPLVKTYYWIPDETQRLTKAIEIFRKEKADCITGWNTHGFDVPYFINRQKKLNIEKSLSPLNIVIANKYGEYKIAGIADLDYMRLYKERFTFDTKDSYSLQAIGMEELGEGKMDYEGEIYDLYKTDWNGFVEYNIQDVLLVEKLEAKKKFIELTLDICYQALIPFDKILSSIAMHEGYALSLMHEMKLVMSDRQMGAEEQEIPGGYVNAKPGRYKWVISFDATSLYPSIILRDNIGPETLRINPENKDNLNKTPLSEFKEWEVKSGTGKLQIGGVYYDKTKQSILAQITTRILTERIQFKKKMILCEQRDSGMQIKEKDKKILEEIDNENGNKSFYDSQQHIRKIMANSLYGALLNKFFHFYNPYNAMNITLSGQDLIKYMGDCFNDYFKNYFWLNKKYFPIKDEKNKLQKDVILLMDTDSVYITLEEIIEKLNLNLVTNEEHLNWINEFVKDEIEPFIDKILKIYCDDFGVESTIKFKREKIISKMFIAGKKHYAVEVLDNEGVVYKEPKMKITGIETVKTSTPTFIRKNFVHILKMILDGQTRAEVLAELKKIKINFKNASIEDIAKPVRISDYNKYAKPIDYYIKNGISFIKGATKPAKASIMYNFLIKKLELKLMPIGNATKLKHISINNNNPWRAEVIGYIGKYPKEFKELFKINYEDQWQSVAHNLVSGWFSVLGWGEINMSENTLKNFFKKKEKENV
jgi:DNA polymerase elongation subunit (family B)